MPKRVRGGRKLKRFLRRAKAVRSIKRVEVGFFATSRYPDGTPVTNVAAWNEFGTRRIPERPFMRRASVKAEKPLVEVARRVIDPEKMVVDRKVGGILGEVLKGEIQRSITQLRRPPLAVSTVAMKGSSNPLIDTGVMRAAVTYRVEE